MRLHNFVSSSFVLYIDLLLPSGAKENVRDYSGHLAGHYLNNKEAEVQDEESELRECLRSTIINRSDIKPHCGEAVSVRALQLEDQISWYICLKQRALIFGRFFTLN